MHETRDIDSEAIGRAVRALRIRAGLRQADLASLCGMSRSYVHRLEQGVLMPGVDKMRRLAAGLGTSVDDVIDLAQSMVDAR